jgi:hypothetical protein
MQSRNGASMKGYSAAANNILVDEEEEGDAIISVHNQ